MKVWTMIEGTLDTGWVDIEIGQRATVYRCSRGNAIFGEEATLKRTTNQHLVFVTDSGAEVKTRIDNLFDVRGKAAKAGYAVSLRKFEKMYHESVGYWNSKKMCFEKK